MKDPAAVAFDAAQMAKAQGFDLVLLDTAGRLHTQKNLMEELKKVQAGLSKKFFPKRLTNVLIVLGGNSGQNAMVQAREFQPGVGIDGRRDRNETRRHRQRRRHPLTRLRTPTYQRG